MTGLVAFWHDDSGAVSSEWVVVTAFAAFLVMTLYNVVSPSVKNLANKIASEIDEATAVLANDGA